MAAVDGISKTNRVRRGVGDSHYAPIKYGSFMIRESCRAALTRQE